MLFCYSDKTSKFSTSPVELLNEHAKHYLQFNFFPTITSTSKPMIPFLATTNITDARGSMEKPL